MKRRENNEKLQASMERTIRRAQGEDKPCERRKAQERLTQEAHQPGNDRLLARRSASARRRKRTHDDERLNRGIASHLVKRTLTSKITLRVKKNEKC